MVRLGPLVGRRPSWSPDGTRIAFVNGRSRLVVANANGLAASLRTPPGLRVDNPSWSPDGSRIVFSVPGMRSRGDLAIVNTNGGGLRRAHADAARGASAGMVSGRIADRLRREIFPAGRQHERDLRHPAQRHRVAAPHEERRLRLRPRVVPRRATARVRERSRARPVQSRALDDRARRSGRSARAACFRPIRVPVVVGPESRVVSRRQLARLRDQPDELSGQRLHRASGRNRTRPISPLRRQSSDVDPAWQPVCSHPALRGRTCSAARTSTIACAGSRATT